MEQEPPWQHGMYFFWFTFFTLLTTFTVRKTTTMNLNDQLQHHQPTATNIDDHGDQGLVC